MNGDIGNPIDVHELVARCGGRVDEIGVSRFAGLLVREERAWGILLSDADSRRRKRFTVAHELGHFCIPTHAKRALLCVSPELSRSNTEKAAEREANDFAAELLLPRLGVQPMIAHGAIDLTRAGQVADAYDVSTVSAALRMCELTRERSAVLYYRDGTLRWAFRFGMPFGLPASGTAPPGDTVAHDVVSGRVGCADGREVELARWLPLGNPERWKGDLLESSVLLDAPGEILTVLWLAGTT